MTFKYTYLRKDVSCLLTHGSQEEGVIYFTNSSVIPLLRKIRFRQFSSINLLNNDFTFQE